MGLPALSFCTVVTTGLFHAGLPVSVGPKLSSVICCSTWLTVVARSTALDCLRARRTERLARHVPYPHHDGHDVHDVEDELAGRLWAEAPVSDDRGELDLPPGLLSRRQSTVLRLLFQDDLDTDEVARTLDIHPKTVRSLKQNALARLRHHFCL